MPQPPIRCAELRLPKTVHLPNVRDDLGLQFTLDQLTHALADRGLWCRGPVTLGRLNRPVFKGCPKPRQAAAAAILAAVLAKPSRWALPKPYRRVFGGRAGFVAALTAARRTPAPNSGVAYSKTNGNWGFAAASLPADPALFAEPAASLTPADYPRVRAAILRVVNLGVLG